MKRRYTATLALLLALSLTACSTGSGPSQSGSSALASQSLPADPATLEAEIAVDTADQYRGLDELGQTIYRRIVYAANSLNRSAVVLPGDAVMEDIDGAFNAVMADMPELFWLQKSLKMITDNGEVRIYLDYSVDSEEELQEMQRKLESAVEEAMSVLPEGADEFNRELLLHDWVVRQVEYDSAAAADQTGEYPQAYTVYGALVEGKAVCEGYARAMQLLLRKAGMGCSLISGKAGGDEHMWNLVTVDGVLYHLDATWDDSIMTEGGQEISHLYFNLTDDEIASTHSDFASPGCTVGDNNYFVRMGRMFDAFDDNTKAAIVSAIAMSAMSGESTLEFRFSSAEAANAAYDSLVRNNEIFSLLTQANASLESPLLDDTNVGFGTADESLHVITILLHFASAG